ARLARPRRPGFEIGFGAVVIADLAGAVRRLGGGDAMHHALVDVHFRQRQEQVEHWHKAAPGEKARASSRAPEVSRSRIEGRKDWRGEIGEAAGRRSPPAASSPM